MHSQTFELLSPCFCAGVSKAHPEMRLPSIRGQLRWWYRILCGTGNPEYELFGGVKGKSFGYDDEAVASRFNFSLEFVPSKLRLDKKMLVPHKKDRRGESDKRFECEAVLAGSQFTLSWSAQPHPDFSAKETDMIVSETRIQQLERVLKAWFLLGTVGRRATRAMGSVWPVGFKPSIAEFNEIVNSLNLPETVRWAVLNAEACDPRHSADDLVKIAGETVHGLKRDQITGDPLGFVAGSSRKASPLRFKIGKFNDGLRLITIWDNRGNRGGDLAGAIAEIQSQGHGQTLADWLSSAGF